MRLSRLRGLVQSGQNQPPRSFICTVSSALQNLLTWFFKTRRFRTNVGESHEAQIENGDSWAGDGFFRRRAFSSFFLQA